MEVYKLALLAMLLAGCAPLSYPALSEYRGVPVLYTRDAAVARAYCGQAGLDLARAEGRAFANGGPVGTVAIGCYVLQSDLMICAYGDNRCLEHEYAHAREGLRHP